MKLSDLRRIKNLKHFAELTELDTITNLGLYQSVIIDTKDIKAVSESISEDEYRHQYDVVSPDVKAFNRYLLAKEKLELPCPCCSKTQPFSTVGWFNPHRTNEWKNEERKARSFIPLSNINGDYDEDEAKQKPLLERIDYEFGTDHFYVSPWNAFDDNTYRELIKNDSENYINTLAQKCMQRILFVASETRKDYRCTLNPDHYCFSGFTLERAVKEKPDELIVYEQRRVNDPDATMTSEEKEAETLYKELEFSIVARKVSQYPSMADLQLFDIEKYRKVLGREHGDYRRALGLYASNIGAGSLVYLRRILESIVEEVHQECKSVSGWDEERYKYLKFNEKIDLIESFDKEIIPPELQPIRNKLYGVISKGVHESSEEDCIEIFPYLKDAIDIFLDAKIAKRERAEKIKVMNARIQKADG